MGNMNIFFLFFFCLFVCNPLDEDDKLWRERGLTAVPILQGFSLNLSNAELYPKRYWQGPRSQDVETMETMLNAALSPSG